MKIKTPSRTRNCQLTVPSPNPNTTESTSFSSPKSHAQAVRFVAAFSSGKGQETDPHWILEQGPDRLSAGRRRARRRREARLLRWAGRGVSDGLAAGATFTWSCCHTTGRDGPGTRSWGEGPARPRPPVPAPAPHSRNPRGLALLPAGSAAAFRARPHNPAARCRWPAEQAALLPRTAPRPGTAPRAPEVPDWEAAAGWGRSAQAPEPRERWEALPGGGAKREAVRTRTTSPPQGKAWVRD